MEKIPLAFGDAVALTWYDSEMYEGWQYHLEKIPQLKLVESLGRVVHNDDIGLTLTVSIGGNRRAAMAPVTVPWQAIQEVHILEEFKIA
jgi:hypothetical protein